MQPSHSRVHAGIPSGGQFSSRTLTESDIDLLPPEQRQITRLHRNLSKSADHWSKRWGLDPEALFDNAFNELSKQRDTLWGEPSYVHTAVRNQAAAMCAGTRSSATLRGYKLYREAQDRFLQDEGREMKPSEKDELAEQIRMSQPAGRRAVKGFHHGQVREVSVDGLDEDSRNDAMFGTSISAANDFEIERRRRLGLDVREVDEDNIKDHGVWNAVAHVYHCAPAQPQHLSESVSAAIRKQVKSLGGPWAVSNAWLNGEISEDAADPLFAPFGDLPYEERDRVAQAIHSIPDNTDRSLAQSAWSDAVREATVPRNA